MRRHSSSHSAESAPSKGADWRAIGTLLPYLREFRGRAILALACLVAAKIANVGVPLLMKHIVDALDARHAVLSVPILLLLAYGALRFSTTMFTELRDMIFARVSQRSIRRAALQVFRHLHALNLRFHLERRTGGVSRDIERGTRGIESLLRFALFSILPTLFEIALVGGILVWKYDVWFAAISLGTVVVYIALTVSITEWRTQFRRRMNEMDSRANTRAIDSLLNYETVKYFGNEEFEARRYDENLEHWETASVSSQTSLAGLNLTQSGVIAVGVTLLMWRSADGVVSGTMTLGDLVLVNSLLLQLYVPLNFLGVIYREIKQALADMEKMFRLLEVDAEVEDAPGAPDLDVGGADVRFEHVDFGYDERRQILYDVDFAIPRGTRVAVVGSSGAGKSTLSRLLFRFYDVGAGRITINGQDIRAVTQRSLRAAIGIVPQDTVLFNDTILYNIAYAKPGATREEVVEAAKAAHIHEFIESLPDGYESMVGERGLKLSGGEKQRVAIARTLLKNPPILVLDEATSALDSKTEKAIQVELDRISANRTTLVIAHRLSTIVEADEILVIEQGRVVERGNHRDLLQRRGVYARMWLLQQQEEARTTGEPGAIEVSA